MIEVLFTDPSDWAWPERLGDSLTFEKIWVNRRLFLSTKARHTFSGYAMSQLKRIMTHRRWLLNPPKNKPERADYELPGTSTIEKEQMGVINATINKQADKLGGLGITKDVVEDEHEHQLVELAAAVCKIPKNLVEVIYRERRYNAAMRNWDQYQAWKEERNPKRSELEAKYGYDTKHAMHLVRLMRMAEEILTTGKVNVKRPDRDELLAIRAGAWSFDKLMEWAHSLDGSLDAAEAVSKLPHSPDRVAIDKLLVESILDRNSREG